MEKASFVERRRDYRLPYHSKVLFSDGQKSMTAFGCNVSRGGLFVTTLDPYPIDTVATASFLLTNQPQSLSIRVKIAHIVYDRQRCEVDCGMGIQFVELSESQKSILNLHILNDKLAYLELKKLLTPLKPNLAEVEKIVKRLPALETRDLTLLRYRVNRICILFEPTPSLYEGEEEEKLTA